MEVQTLLDLNRDMESKTKELETRITEAHEKYVASKTKTNAGKLTATGVLKKPKRSISGRFEETQRKDIHNAYSGTKSVRSGGRNQSMGAASQRGDGYAGNRSHSSSYAFLHLTKDLESIYKEFEAGEMNELNKLRRLVSHFRGLSRRF